MSYRTIVVHADLSPHAAARIRAACAVARLTGAHLIGAAMTGVSRFIVADQGSALGHGTGHRQADDSLAQFDALASGAASGSCEKRIVADDVQGGLVRLGRCCDLVVLSQTDPDLPAGAATELPAAVAMNAAAPVLLVPYARAGIRPDGHAMIAWNGSAEASRAVRDALPLLRHAARVSVAHVGTADDCLAAQAVDLLAWLGRHGIAAAPIDRPGANDEGEALLSLAADEQADLIVMGAYSHSRFRELALGGVTRTMLQRMTSAVIMSH